MNRRDLWIGLGLLALAAVFLAPVTLGGRTLVPFDDLFRYPPWSAFAAQFGITNPHNPLALDLVLENYVWKQFIVQSLHAREIPLWNPYLFAGVPFLAAGQNSALYPFSALFYVLPIEQAFGYFVALQLALAAAAMYVFGRILRLSRVAALLSAVVYAFSGFMVVSTTFPMVLSAVAWLPAVLACVEMIAREARSPVRRSGRVILFSLIGAILLGVQFLAGHAEFSIYILMVTGLYALWRVFIPLALSRKVKLAIGHGGAIVAMIGLGIGAGGVQLIPLYELVQKNFRSGSATLADVIGWAFPLKQAITFLIPDFYGNPTHHSYLDVFDWSNHAAPYGTIFWGPKNYVEAGSYVGILPLVLAAVAALGLALSWFRRSGLTSEKHDDRRAQTSFFVILAIISLLFTFGTPLYAILFYLVPGFNQLHTAFRWVFPYTFSMAVLAGLGAQFLTESHGLVDLGPFRSKWPDRIGRVLPWILISLGAVMLVVLFLSRLFWQPAVALADRVLQSSHAAPQAFDSGRMFYSYEFPNFLLFGILLLGAGAILRVARCQILLPARLGGHAVWKPLALALIVVDLFTIGVGFYPAADARLASFKPPAVDFLQQDHSLYRVTSYDDPSDQTNKVLNANGAMLYGIQDIRGYDSIIPKQYADLMGALAPQNELQFNRIASFYQPDALSSPILDLLNVKYVLTTRDVPNAGYTLVYDKEIKIYRNDHVLPRAFVVPNARVIPDPQALLDEMKHFDPSAEVLLEEPAGVEAQPVAAVTCRYEPIQSINYSGNTVEIKTQQKCGGWLVLSDSYFPGWIAQIDGRDVPLYRADYNFRAVYLPEGEHTVYFKYSPLSFRVGLITSFLSGMLLLLGFAYLAWRRFYHPAQESEVQRVAKNSLLPMITSLLMKVVSIAFAFFSLRILGPSGKGGYTWAVTMFGFASTISDFGLGILLTRDVTRDRSLANRYLTNSLILRILLWAVALVPFGILAWGMRSLSIISHEELIAFGFLMAGMLPGSLSASLAFLFNAYERFEYRVAVDVATVIVSTTLMVLALLLGYGFVGLAAVSVVTNVFTAFAFYFLVRAILFAPRIEIDLKLVRWMFFESYPLMLNNLLSGLFFRIDVLILQVVKGVEVLGYYSTAYSFIDALNFIPSNFTLAIFPALSRMASSAKDNMLRAYLLSLRILLWISLPITVGTVLVSRELIGLFAGDAYLPHSAIALQVLIWFLPFSFVNSVTHYVLIALGQQRFLTKAFILGVVFNVAANLIAIPSLGYVGAALTTILSEIVLLGPFYYSVRKNLAPVPFGELAWRPALASGVMGLALWWAKPLIGVLAAVPLAGVLYLVLLVALGALGEDERAILRRLMPQRWQRLARIAE